MRRAPSRRVRARRLRATGLRLSGTVQTDVPRADRSLCDMELTVLPDGPVFRINQDRGEAARGCRLDSSALEEAVVEVAEQVTPRVASTSNFGGSLQLRRALDALRARKVGG